MVAMTATRTIQPAQTQKSGPSRFLVGSAASSAAISSWISARSFAVYDATHGQSSGRRW